MENLGIKEFISSSACYRPSEEDGMSISGRYIMVCYDADGNEKWREEYDNVVTAQGKRHTLDWALAGTANAVSSRMILIQSGTAPSVSDTYTTRGFTEFTNIASRPSITWSAATGTDAVSKSPSASVTFNINAGSGVTVIGSGIVLTTASVTTLGTPGDTAQSGGVLYSAGTFTNGSKPLSSGDTLQVTYTANISAG